jgi:hypothetical protein
MHSLHQVHKETRNAEVMCLRPYVHLWKYSADFDQIWCWSVFTLKFVERY